MKYAWGLFLVAAISCNSSDKATTETEDSANNPVATSLITDGETCFLYTTGSENQDSTFVSLKISGDSVVGFMHWQPWETDGAYGTISATKEGDTIFGTYDYQIEGSSQQEEILFKTINGTLVKGEGELKEEIGDKVLLKYKDIGQVTYETVFKPIDCRVFIKY